MRIAALPHNMIRLALTIVLLIVNCVDHGEVLPINVVHGTQGQLVLFLVLNMWPSHFGLPVLLAIVLSRRVKRHATFANLCVAFIIIGM